MHFNANPKIPGNPGHIDKKPVTKQQRGYRVTGER